MCLALPRTGDSSEVQSQVFQQSPHHTDVGGKNFLSGPQIPGTQVLATLKRLQGFVDVGQARRSAARVAVNSCNLLAQQKFSKFHPQGPCMGSPRKKHAPQPPTHISDEQIHTAPIPLQTSTHKCLYAYTLSFLHSKIHNHTQMYRGYTKMEKCTENTHIPTHTRIHR